MRLRDRLGIYGLLAALNLLLLFLLHQEWPRAGFDLSYFLPRLVDVQLHYLCNGVSLQWWTPSFGGGLPAFPNPQHTQFMLAQLLLPWTDPWTAVVLNMLLPFSLGFLLVVKCGIDLLRWTPNVSLIAAAIFSTNNFFLYHAFSGHLGFLSFPLMAVLPFCFHSSLSLRRAVALFAATGAAIVLSGGYTIIIVYWLTAFLLAGGLALADENNFAVARSLRVLIAGSILLVSLCAAKVCAVALFMQQFPRLVTYAHPAATLAGAWLSVPAQLLLWKPLLFLERIGGPSADEIFAHWTGSGVEDLGLSPMALLLVPVGLIAWIKNWRGPMARPLAFTLAVGIWLTVEITLGRGLWWPWLKPLPFFRSLQANSRFGSAFILPAALLCGFGAQALTDWLRPTVARTGFVLAAVILTFVSLLPFRRYMGGLWFGGFNVSAIQTTWTAIRAGNHFTPVAEIADVRDDRVFLQRASSLKPYEPIFGYGYGGPDFHSELDSGPIQPPSRGVFRLNHPVAFYAPGRVNLQPFARVPADQAPSVELFLQRRQPPAWDLPPVQRIANGVSLLTLITMAWLCLWPLRRPLAPDGNT